MKKAVGHLVTLIICLMFLVGVSIFSFPYVSGFVHMRAQTRVVEGYNQSLEKIDDSRFDEIIRAARAYNYALAANLHRWHPTEDDLGEYHGMLKIECPDDGVIGTLEIERLGISLPIYRGTDDAVLRAGLGHIEGTSLPVGGLGTHAVITGHRGLPDSPLLTDIDRMVVGDVFVLNVLNLRLYYVADRIDVVLPDDFSRLAIYPCMDYATLLTCTPIGVNSHRLLVRGVRVDDVAVSEVDGEVGACRVGGLVCCLLLLLVVCLLVVLVVLFVGLRRLDGDF